MYSPKAEALFDYVDFLRNLINERLDGRPNDEESYPSYACRTLRLNKCNDWNFICSGMDLVGDTCLSLDHFLKFGMEGEEMDGASANDKVGVMYLRLYGALNSTYIQQEAVFTIYKLCQVHDASSINDRIKNLAIRDIRHKLGAHSIDYIDYNDDKKILSFVPVRVGMGGLYLDYINNNDHSQTSVDLLLGINEHLDLMTDIVETTLKKIKKTLYKSNSDKVEEIDKDLEKLRAKRKGEHVPPSSYKPITF